MITTPPTTTTPDLVDEANNMLGRMAGEEAQRRVREQIKHISPDEVDVWNVMDRLVVAEREINPKSVATR